MRSTKNNATVDGQLYIESRKFRGGGNFCPSLSLFGSRGGAQRRGPSRVDITMYIQYRIQVATANRLVPGPIIDYIHIQMASIVGLYRGL